MLLFLLSIAIAIAIALFVVNSTNNNCLLFVCLFAVVVDVVVAKMIKHRYPKGLFVIVVVAAIVVNGKSNLFATVVCRGFCCCW